MRGFPSIVQNRVDPQRFFRDGGRDRAGLEAVCVQKRRNGARILTVILSIRGFIVADRSDSAERPQNRALRGGASRILFSIGDTIRYTVSQTPIQEYHLTYDRT